jgi:molybdopterin-guanine dinucleotide biosynthesis protein
MYYWTPKRIKELKEKGYKLRLVKHDPGDEQADKRASKQASKRTSSDQASEEDSSNKR